MHDSPNILCSRHCSRQWICTTVVRELLGVCVVNNPPYLDIVHFHLYIHCDCMHKKTNQNSKQSTSCLGDGMGLKPALFRGQNLVH